MLRRNDQMILDTYNDLWDKVWWTRHRAWQHQVESGEITLSDEQRLGFDQACATAAEIERRYGLESLELDPFEVGLLSGRMSALGWVLGSEWDESLDT